MWALRDLKTVAGQCALAHSGQAYGTAGFEVRAEVGDEVEVAIEAEAVWCEYLFGIFSWQIFVVAWSDISVGMCPEKNSKFITNGNHYHLCGRIRF
jgi:hypothetical protein